ncbi:MAG: hypothetical protein HN627_10395, partial [Opitutae bacterium]|nr:hypothetical protein [Opitutae bacterium]
QSDDGGYQSDDGGYQSDDGGYQSDDGGYQSDDSGYQSNDGGYHPVEGEGDDETDDEHNATIDLSEPVGVLDLADQDEVTDFASDFGSIWFQYYDKDKSGDFGPGDPWTLSIEEGEEGALETVTVDMDGFVFAGDFEAYWQQVLDISLADEDWHETQYASTSAGIVSLYEDYPFLQGGDFGDETEPGPPDGEHDEHHLAIVKTTDFDLLDDGLVRLSGSLLYDGDDEHTVTGFVISESLLLADEEFQSGPADGEDGDHNMNDEFGSGEFGSADGEGHEHEGDHEFEFGSDDGKDEEHELHVEFESGKSLAADGEEQGHEHGGQVRVIAIDDNDDGDFSFEFEPSLSGATYYYRAYAINEAGVSYGAPRKFVSEHFDDHLHDEEADDFVEGENVEDDDPWAEATPLEAGWLDVPWFGTLLTFDDNDWVFHDGLGWLYTVPDGEGGVWLWQEERGWLWTKPGLWPYLFEHDHAEWIYFLLNREGRAYFYNYSTNSAE